MRDTCVFLSPQPCVLSTEQDTRQQAVLALYEKLPDSGNARAAPARVAGSEG